MEHLLPDHYKLKYSDSKLYYYTHGKTLVPPGGTNSSVGGTNGNKNQLVKEKINQ